MLVERKIPREKNLNMSKSVGKIVAFERKRERFLILQTFLRSILAAAVELIEQRFMMIF